MPTYRYDGNVTFINNEYKIIANNGDTILTDWVLPSNWTDFTLLDINVPDPVLPYSDDLTISNTTIISMDKYYKMSILLKNPDSSILRINVGDISSKSIILDNNLSSYTIEKKTGYSHIFKTIYLTSASGTCEVRIIVQ